jgi:cytochrome c oxidase assembly protein subunit 11
MTPAATPSNLRRSNNRMLLILGAFALGMMLFFLFGFKTIYTLYCAATGTAMKPNNEALALAPAVSTGRFITVRFESRIFDGLPVTFVVDAPQSHIEVGQEAKVTYRVTNTSDRPVHLRPVHQVSPINATLAFGMRICFCFQDQVLAPHETKSFPVVYKFAPTLDRRIHDVALCYSLFDVADGKASAELVRTEAEAKRALLAEPEE